MDTVSAAAIRENLHTAVFGRELIAEKQLASTNTRAKELAATGAPEGTAVIADAQSAGRGRRGRTFYSPVGGVYLSVILRPTAPVDAGLITSCAAVAAARAIRRLCPLDVRIKWVNDLLIGGKKVCGILAESSMAPDGTVDAIVLGIGINVAATPLPEELKHLVTSLEAEGFPVDRNRLIAALLEEWEAAYATAATGDFLAESRRLSAVLGNPVTVVRGEDSFPAVAEEITDRGHLVVRTEAGERITLTSGEVSIRL